MGMIKDNENSELLPKEENRIISTSTLLQVGEQYYQVKPLMTTAFSISDAMNNLDNPFTLAEGFEFDPDCAYLKGEYFYLYRGKLSDVKGFEDYKPGIYYDDNRCIYVLREPATDEEKEEYQYADKITRQDADEIRKAVINHDVIIYNTPDSAHSVIPPESMDDDILKKLIKRAITQKGVDLDQYKTRFASKNMLFNTKQVLRGPNRLSMLLFDRCAEALNLKYTIILEEAGGETIGHKLRDKIVISSHDTFDANIYDATSEKEDKN